MATRTQKLKDEIKGLLQKYYPSELRGLRLSTHASGIADATQDSLLWVRLIHGNEVVEAYALAQTVENKLLKDTEDVVKKRMSVLETCCQGKPDLASLRRNYSKLFENALQHKDSGVAKSVYIDVDCTLDSPDRQDDSECVLQGVVVDIYLTPSEQWVGYVSLHKPEGHATKLADAVFKFDSKALARSWCTLYPLHIGDAVEFSASGTNEVQNCTMRIVEYPPAISLDETFIQHYFSRIKQFSSESSLPTLLLQPPAPWKSFLNEKAIYSIYYKEILALCFSFSQPNATESPVLPPELMRIVRGSAFIREVPNLLKQDPRQNCDEVTTEYESYRRDVHAAIHLLITLTKHSPDYAYQIADAFKSLVRLSQGKFQGEIQSIILALVDTYLTPDSLAVQTPELSSIEHSVESMRNMYTTQDPHFWVRLLYNGSIEKSCYLTAVSASNNVFEKVVAKRQEMLKKYSLESLKSLDVAKLESQMVLAQVEKLKAACPQKIDLKNETEIAESSNSALQGVVIDIYPAPASAGKVEGYIAVCPDAKHGQDSAQSKCHVYKFDSSTPILKPTGGCLLPLHIGDTIAFKPADGSEVGTVLEVVEYCPHALSKEFAAHYFSYIKPAEGIEALLRVLESPAPWKGILNNPALYQEYCDSILTVCNACNSTDTAAIPDATKMLAHTFKRCSFIQNLPTVLDQDIGKAEMTDQYLSKVRIAVNLLNCFVQHLGSEAKTEAKTVAKVLKYMGKMLSSVTMYPEFQSLTLSLIDVYLAPPASLALNKRPWRTIPTLLTEQEFEISAGSPMEELPKVRDSGRYNSIDEYGRTYFTLLRADCYGELIDTVARLKTPCSSVQERQDTFYRVKFVGLSQGSDRNIVYAFHFEAHLPLEKSQDSILTQGNLMCFSIGGQFKFKRDLVWGTVDKIAEGSGGVIEESGKEVLLKEGKMYVQLWPEANQDEEVMVLLKQSENVVAVESPAYFRAYYPVLEALKNLELERVHFRDDLLHPGAEVKSKPEILSDNTKVDPRPLYKTSCKCIPKEMTVRQLKEALLDKDVDKDEDSSQLCLDLSQRDAIYKALLHPLTVIQGPPGTGKTFIAIKLLNIFLSMNTLPNDKPTLVMAYKNRALDHFIDGCLDSSVCDLQDIVRIGHTSEGYDHFQSALLSKRVKQAMSRTSWIEHLHKLQLLYRRIQQASGNLHKRGKLTLQNCLSSITPEWLQSILLEAPPQLARQLNIPQDLKLKLQCDPKRTLDLLKEEIMGGQDYHEKKAVNTALCEAWKAWTADLEPLTAVIQQESAYRPSSDCGESEEDFAQLQQERLMATDDLDDQENGFKDSLEANMIDLTVNQDIKIEDYHTHVWNLSPGQRKQLVLSAVIGSYSDALDNMKQSLKDYNKTLESYEWKRQAERLRVLRGAKVVAMTTTGAAIHQQLLNKLEAPVMFVEEAAEVLESNLLACLTPHVKHLVLIGDHKQLKPKVACWKLAKNHRFNTSLFERLVNNNFPYTILMRQSRMHPKLVRLFSYHYTLQKKEAGQLKSTKRTREYYHPPCMAQEFFWWSYTEHLEEKRGGAISNPYEVRMVIALCIWLLSQTTENFRITILTPYRAQLKQLQDGLKAKANQLTIKKLPSSVLIALATIPVLTVDEFQGHESDVIILSLVRNNKQKRLGFLSQENRLVVGTSRQKRALYIIGNAKFLEASSPVVWKKFIQRLKNEDIGDAVPVIQHKKIHNCTTPEDLETRAYERQESTPDLTECDSPVRNEPRRTSSQSQIDEHTGREAFTGTDDTIPVTVHYQETHNSTTPGTTTIPFGAQRQESTPDLTECDSPVSNAPRRTSSQSQTDEHTGREAFTATDDTIPVAVHCQETTTPGTIQTSTNPLGTQRQESASDTTNQSTRVHMPQPLSSPQRASSLGEEPMGKMEVAFRQQSSPATLQAEEHSDRYEKFRTCCLELQKTAAVNKWKMIGRRLNIDDSTIEMLKEEEKGDERLYQIMKRWWQENGTDATPEKLIEALEFAKLHSVVEKVKISW